MESTITALFTDITTLEMDPNYDYNGKLSKDIKARVLVADPNQDHAWSKITIMMYNFPLHCEETYERRRYGMCSSTSVYSGLKCIIAPLPCMVLEHT